MSGLPLVREKSGKFKVREFLIKSGKFRILKKVREICRWSGKFRCFGRHSIHAMPIRGRRIWYTCIIYGICCFVYFLNFKNFMFIHTMSCMCLTCLRRRKWAVMVVASGWSWLMSRSSVFAHLKMSVESLKSQGNLLSYASGNPGNLLTFLSF